LYKNLKVKVKVQGHRGQKMLSHPIDNAWLGDASAVGIAARSSRRVHCVAARGEWVTAVHVDGGLCAVLSGAVLAGAATPVGKSAPVV